MTRHLPDSGSSGGSTRRPRPATPDARGAVGDVPGGRTRAAPSAVTALGAFFLAAAVGALTSPPAAAQEAEASPTACQFRAPAGELDDRLSPPDSASARMGGGVVKVCYGSPRARGREIFGDLVPYGQPWRLGANEPTALHTTVALRFGDVRLEPGSYSLYAIPGREQWEVVVNGSTDRWGVPINDEVRAHDVGAVTVEAQRLDRTVEALTMELVPSGKGLTDLVIRWERSLVRVPLRRDMGG